MRRPAESNEDSVAALSEKIAGSLGLDVDRYAPRETPAAGAFDHATAQIEDVTRGGSATDGFRYKATLIDAAGRTVSVPMTAEDGEPLYRTFGRIKSSPMAGAIYRKLVMPMLQGLVEDAAP